MHVTEQSAAEVSQSRRSVSVSLGAPPSQSRRSLTIASDIASMFAAGGAVLEETALGSPPAPDAGLRATFSAALPRLSGHFEVEC